jgi:hypothetical protein
MPYTMEDYKRDLKARLLKEFAPELKEHFLKELTPELKKHLLNKLSLEDRLEGVPSENRLEALIDDAIEALIKKLKEPKKQE